MTGAVSLCLRPSLEVELEDSESSHNIEKRKRSVDEDEGSGLAEKRPHVDASVESKVTLCQRCRDINWPGLASPPASEKGKDAADFPAIDRSILSQSSCPICRMVAQVVPKILDGENCRLKALSSSLAILGRVVRTPDRIEHSDCTVLFPVLKAKADDKTAGSRIAKDWQDAGCLALVETGGDHERLLETGPRSISPLVNFDLIKGWLELCTEQHHKTCETTGGGSGHVQGLRVIDCNSEETIDAPTSCRYFALSYVWGPPPSVQCQTPGDNNNNKNPETHAAKFSKVVRDAMEVTRSLGEQYLWVDQFCIDQNDGPAKRAQIAQMHEIYSRAHLTIIAAAGDRSSYGLPGVGTKQRLLVECVTIDNITVIRMLPHTLAQIFRTKWAERGWIYQECYLSPRRLIFTDHEVSYLCNAMHRAETVKKPRDLSNAETKNDINTFQEIIPSQLTLRRVVVPGRFNHTRWDNLKNKQLPNYTRRNLTNTSDSINAALGLFRALETSAIRHLHGIPIHRASVNSSHQIELSLAWHHEEIAKRCLPFPSWSWSGWRGGIQMSEPDIRDSDVEEIALVDEDGNTLPLHDWFDNEMRNPNSSSTSAPYVLRISATTVWLKFEERNWDELNGESGSQSRIEGMEYRNGTYAVLPISEEVTALSYVYLDEHVPLDAGALGLVLSSKPRRYSILLVRQNGDHHYQRIGLIRVAAFQQTRPAAVGNFDPSIIYVDDKGEVLTECVGSDGSPRWLRGGAKRSITIS